jgi:aminocarboxymuconate-semialdehyde decarboxylase
VTAGLTRPASSPTVAAVTIVDCQTHLHCRTYFEAHVRRRGYPRAERDGGGFVFHTSDGNSNPIPAHYWDVERQLEHFEAQGLDVVVSSMGAFTVDHLPVEMARGLAIQLNEERAQLERHHPGRFYALAIIPMQDTPTAVEVLDHAIGTLGLRGVCIGSNVNGESIAAPERRPIFDRIAELGVPVFLHPTASVMEDRVRRYGHEYTVGFMVDTSLAALDLVFSGVFDEQPTLKVVHPHLGGVLPYLAARVDIEHANPWSGTRALERPPSEYLPRFYTDTVSGSTGALELAMTAYGRDRVLFASDYPYWSPSEGLTTVAGALHDGDLDAVMSGNARSLLGIA